VARYVECPDTNVYSQNLTCIHLTGTDVRAEQQLDIHRLIVGGGCQAEQIRAELDKKIAANVEAQKIGRAEHRLKLATNFQADLRDAQSLALEEVRAEQLGSVDRIMIEMKKGGQTDGEEEHLEICKKWREFRNLKRELSENESKWQTLNVKEGWKIRAEGRKLRVEAIQNKKKRFGKVCRKGLSDLEEELIKIQTTSQLELKEVEQNLAMHKKDIMLESNRRKGIPEGRKETNASSKRLEKLGKMEEVWESKWRKLEIVWGYIEKRERWMDSRWLENSSLDEQRLKKRRLETYRGKERLTEESDRSEERRDIKEMKERDAHQVKKDGKCRKDGNYKKDGKSELEERKPNEAKSKTQMQKQNEEEKKISNQVEENSSTMFLRDDSSMFGNFKFDKVSSVIENRKKKKLSEEGKEEEISLTIMESCKVGKLTDIPCDSGKMELEMRTTVQRPSASHALLVSRTRCQERSVGGLVMKNLKGGTPKKLKNVKILKKCFENGAANASLGKGWVGLRQMQQETNLLANPGDSKSARRELEICASQWEGGTQTGPRKDGDRVGVPGYDWTRTPSQGYDVPTRAGLPGVEESRNKK
jgi:hypothetical protein